jgi:hypothetical protein
MVRAGGAHARVRARGCGSGSLPCPHRWPCPKPRSREACARTPCRRCRHRGNSCARTARRADPSGRCSCAAIIRESAETLVSTASHVCARGTGGGRISRVPREIVCAMSWHSTLLSVSSGCPLKRRNYQVHCNCLGRLRQIEFSGVSHAAVISLYSAKHAQSVPGQLPERIDTSSSSPGQPRREPRLHEVAGFSCTGQPHFYRPTTPRARC